MRTYTITRRQDLNTTRWSGGTTTQLAIWPADGDYASRRFSWRVSSAVVEDEESTFTSLPGVERTLMILEGSLQLEHEGHYTTVLEQFDQDNFSGSWTTRSRGRVTDFNLMVSSGEGRVQVTEVPLRETLSATLQSPTDKWASVSEVFYCLSDNVHAVLPDDKEAVLNRGDVLTVHSDLHDATPPSPTCTATHNISPTATSCHATDSSAGSPYHGGHRNASDTPAAKAVHCTASDNGTLQLHSTENTATLIRATIFHA